METKYYIVSRIGKMIQREAGIDMRRIDRVTAWCASDNIASKRTLEKAGMRLDHIETDGLEVDGMQYDRMYLDRKSVV